MMGCNFYLYGKPPCPSCGRHYEPRHIGKSSGGWTFALHVCPADGINDLCDWEREWSRDGAEIRDEYGRVIHQDEMKYTITERCGETVERWTARDFSENHAVPGPNGLARRRVDGIHCIRHGSGTWDLIVGEFS